MNRLEKALHRLDTDLRALGLRWALVGGMAVSMRAEPRTTRDLDLVVTVSGDTEAEQISLAFKLRGYSENPDGHALEHKHTQRLATVRFLSPAMGDRSIGVDLLFASSGVEAEVVAAAEILEIFPRVRVPIAQTGHLLALKVLAGREHDIADFRSLLAKSGTADLQLARETLELITRRGYDREKDLLAEFTRLLEPIPGSTRAR